MEGDVQSPLVRSPRRVPRRSIAGEDEHRVLPDELRDRGAVGSVPQPPVAPNLTHRVRGPHGRLALPLLPPRRATPHLRPTHQRPPRTRPHGYPHRCSPPPYRRHPQHPHRTPRWRRPDACTRRP